MRALASRLGRLLREPLVQFLLLGAALFLLYRAVSPQPEAPPDRIVVDAAQIARLAQQFERTWLRPPTRAELDGLIEGHVTEEILYREALALGLEKNDLVIRRRLRQKMDFLNEDLGAQREPADAELQAYLDAHGEKFAAPVRTSFAHVYLKPEGDRAAARARAEALRKQLEAGAVPAEAAGDATLLPRVLENASPREVARSFGEPFAAALETLPVGERWRGPIETEYGLHLVKVAARDPGGPLPLSAVRAAVVREWSAAQRAAAKARFYAALRERYTVSIERTAGDKAAAVNK
ncbi:MAG TPA: peptidylprolyl isomerase [Burkholderiales bacterium]|nr:peptidylprolyl isomerase [Burkholderiales bacterium]